MPRIKRISQLTGWVWPSTSRTHTVLPMTAPPWVGTRRASVHGMADTIVLPIAGLGILVMDRATFDAALSAGRALVPSEAPKPRTSTRGSDAQLLDAEQLEAVTAVPATWWMAAARARRIPFRKIGRRVRFVLEEIIACEELKRRELEQALPRESLAIKLKKPTNRSRPHRRP